MDTPSAALVLGASGSVGDALVRHLVADGALRPIVTLVRRSQPEQRALAQSAGIELREVVVACMTPAALQEATAAAARNCPGGVVGLSVLGVGAGTAKLTLTQHRAIDVELNVAFARGLATSGRGDHLLLMSAVGADAGASALGSGAPGLSRYARVKGEAEQACKAQGLAHLSIFRPAMIVGSRHTPWLLERLLSPLARILPAKYASIKTQQIARAMVAVARRTPTQSAVYHVPEMLALDH